MFRKSLTVLALSIGVLSFAVAIVGTESESSLAQTIDTSPAPTIPIGTTIASTTTTSSTTQVSTLVTTGATTSTEPEPTAPSTYAPDTAGPFTSSTLRTTSASTTTSTSVPAGNGPSLAPICGVTDGRGAGCRLIAYYGNPLARGMGILGRLDQPKMIASLKRDVAMWQRADQATPTRCVLELITVVVQASPGPSGLYRARSNPDLVRKVIGWAREAGCITLLDMQVGWSNVAAELPYIEPFLREPDVHLALDPEWDMPEGVKPGTSIGTMDAADINAAVDLLEKTVTERKLPRKLLVVHRFRDFMVTNPSKIKTPDAIRLVVNMDGFGSPSRKLESYAVALRGMPTTLSGFKLFTKIDTPMLTPEQVLGGKVKPVPVFINYQ